MRAPRAWACSASPGGQVEGDWLPAQGATFLGEPDQAAVDVEVHDPQAEGAAASACGFGVQPR
jgi:hypothetical protein